jgi:hypothetical protein
MPFSANSCLSLMAGTTRGRSWEVKRQNWLIGARRDAYPGSRTAANIRRSEIVRTNNEIALVTLRDYKEC